MAPWWHKIREKGIRNSVMIFYNHLEGIFFDWYYGTDTQSRVLLQDLRIDHEKRQHGTKYDPSPVSALRKLFRKIEITKEDVWVDVGAGKGRTLLIASVAGFKKVVGIEFSAELCDICRQNIEKFRRKKKTMSPVEVINKDATEVNPDKEYTVFFLFNPFDAEIMTAWMDKVKESFRNFPRRMYIIYNNPVHQELIDRYSFLKERKIYRIHGREFAIYKTA